MYKKIMVTLDGSDLAECVLPHVEAFITGCQVDTIVFVRVIEPNPANLRMSTYVTSPEEITKVTVNAERAEAERKSSAEQYLQQVINRFKQNVVKLQTEVIVGKVADSLVDYTEANDIDLILMATHGRSGIGRWVRGSIADRILRSSRVPVLMVRAPGTMSGS